uniref:Uncharacterized protein n=1 Tax=Ralstonia solanacearum TaxID=305 RepID=A0A0S4UV39_RALSL|nr:protein of unknown function [Ralstonia solanacearum]CUV35049.1 protein of unknown function [Ralstonia solanacearum]CUV38491.1 protein of unknown function [Ralstonia solanacearum]CUV59128.1 protein of unknown function [Ralstonia solanacearum]
MRARKFAKSHCDKGRRRRARIFARAFRSSCPRTSPVSTPTMEGLAFDRCGNSAWYPNSRWSAIAITDEREYPPSQCTTTDAISAGRVSTNVRMAEPCSAVNA